MKLKINLDSYTLCGSGEGAGLIDNDVVFDKLGFPYLPGRRIKGLLRESAQEVLEMLDKDVSLSCLLSSLFGSRGFKPGTLKIPNLYLPDYDVIRAYTEELMKDRNMSAINIANIIATYTETRAQTALEKDGIAVDGSLRTSRLLKPRICFYSEIESLSKPEEALLFLATHNLKRMGTRRNRGQGKISCCLKESIYRSINQAIEALMVPNDEDKSVTAITADRKVVDQGTMKRLPYIVTVQSSLVISKPIGDENTVNTNNYLPGNSVKGLLAHKIMKARGLTKATAHTDEIFYRLMLSTTDALIISPAYPCKDRVVFLPAPMALHTDKSNDQTLFNLLQNEPDQDAKYREEMLNITENDINLSGVDKTLFFHSSRFNNRVQGKSAEEETEGEIFFYEAIDPGQVFRGWIFGTEDSLQCLANQTSNRFKAAIGRSRSAQYGNVKIEFESILNENAEDVYDGASEFVMSALSPIILYNQYGTSEIGSHNFETWLSDFFEVPVQIVNSFARLAGVENYVGVWGMKTPREAAYAEGSTFQIHISGLDPAKRTQKVARLLSHGIGERTDAGFGRICILNLDHPDYDKNVARSGGANYPAESMPESLRLIIKDILRYEIRNQILEKGIKHSAEYNPPLNNHQIGRLEQMITGMGRNAFIESINLLKKLDTCKNRAGANLPDKLKEFDGDVKCEVDIMLSGDLRHIMSRAALEQKDVAVIDELARDYWVSLLRQMRKDNRGRRN